jgi:monoamine oxidase
METTRRDCLRQAGTLLAGGFALGRVSPAVARGDEGDAVDVCVYGATASGIMAAVAATREGMRVVVIEPSRWLGGMTGGGLSHVDWGRGEAVGEVFADEVTHVKMGSDWLRKVTANDPQRQKDALEFQKAVDKLFSFGGFRGERAENPVHLARHFRTLAGFSSDEIDELVVISAEAYDEAAALITQAQAAMASASPA